VIVDASAMLEFDQLRRWLQISAISISTATRILISWRVRERCETA
jgi:hypothetical protein